MDVLLESPVALLAIGGVLVTFMAIWYTQSRSKASLGALAAVVLLTLLGIAFERWWQTPREQVISTVRELFAAIEADDLPGVLARIDPAAANVRADAEALMPQFRVEVANPGTDIGIEINGDAHVQLKAAIRVQHPQSGAIGGYFDTLDLTFVRQGDRWLLSDYTPAQDWRSAAKSLSR